jgi:GNAT superfamily N-acetyltransferase
MSDSYHIRPATVDDLPDLIRLRRLMFEAMGFTDPDELKASDEICAGYFTRAIPAGEFHGWVAEAHVVGIVASGGVVVDRHPPGPHNLDGRIAYIMNMSTDPAHRRRGLARRILDCIVAWAGAEGITTAALHATADGKPLYREFGFADGNEMRARL